MSGFTLVEVMVAVAVLGLTLFSVMGGIAFMGFRNRESSQRMLAASIETEILELFKAQPSYAGIRYSTPGAPILLKSGGASDSQRWMVPLHPTNDGTMNEGWQKLPVEDVASGESAVPGLVTPDKLPNGMWRVDFDPDPAEDDPDPNKIPPLRQITVTLRWQLHAGSPWSVPLSTSTTVCKDFPNL